MIKNKSATSGFAHLSIFLAITCLLLVWLHRQDTAVQIAAPEQSTIACVSYAPYRGEGESPFVNSGAVSPERIREDLTLIKTRTNCVRTYAVSEGLDAVPAIAAELGMQVMLGIWIGREHEQNLTKIDQALTLVNKHPDTVRALIVGNEVLLRREQTRARIADYLQRAKAGSKVPVTYADVWEFWEVNASLQTSVDFVTIHILPYWEDHPVAIEDAIAHVAQTFTHVQTLFPGKKLFIGETGWPSTGRMRGPARPGLLEQARFVREFLAWAQSQKFSDYNLIEAFDQRWKRRLEGAMGAGWGLLDADGKAKFELKGPVARESGALRKAILAGLLVGFLCAVVSAALVGRDSIPSGRFGRLVLAGVSGFFAGALLPAQLTYLTQWSRSELEWAAGLLVVACSLTLICRLPWLQTGQAIAGVADRPGRLPGLWSGARFGLLFGLAVMLVLHAFDARYRGFPTVLYLPGAAALISAMLTGSGTAKNAIEERWLCGLVIALVPFCLWPELPHNTQALMFTALALTAALSCLAWPRANTSTPSTKPSAPGSAV